MQKNVETLVELISLMNADIKTDINIDNTLLRYCIVDKRSRLNFVQQFIEIFA